MKSSSIIRTDRWLLQVDKDQQMLLRQTVVEYRRLVQALVGVVFVHWPRIGASETPLRDVELLIHQTTKNPTPRYRYFREHFYKFPSYYRRVAINEAIGQASSFVTRYSAWQSGQRSRRSALPPRLNGNSGSWPTLYRGQCVKFDEQYQTAEIKVFNGQDWVWITAPIARKRQRHTVSTNKLLSPKLVLTGKRFSLSVPFKIKVKQRSLGETVCAVDLGINTTATASIVHQDGTVTARKFIHFAADIDRRDKRLKRISKKARLTMGPGGSLSTGFCKGLYRKAKHINLNITQHTSKQLLDFAKKHNCAVVVFERLKGFRPTGGKKGSSLRQRFHGWLHRRIVDLTQQKFQEIGGRLAFVNPFQTSKRAYDGSGMVRRDASNYALAAFSSGKQYNADLSASYNIGARFWHKQRGGGNDPSLRPDQSFRRKPRIPVTLSTLWRDVDTPTTAA